MKHLYFSFIALFLSFFTSFTLAAQDKEALADSTYKTGMQHYMRGEVNTAAEYFKQVVQLRSQTDSSRLINTFSNLGRCYAEMGFKEESWACYINALRLCKKFNNEKGLGYLYNNMGVLERELGREQEAEAYFQKGLEVSKRIKNEGSEALCNESLAISLVSSKAYDKAEKHLVAAFEIYERSNNLPMLTSVLINLGNIASLQKKDTEAIEWFEQGKKTALRIGNYAHVVVAVTNTNQIYLDLGKPKEALQSSLEILPLLDSVQLLPVQCDFYQSLGAIYSANAMWEKALKTNQTYHILQDSLFSEEQQKYLTSLKTQYEVNEKEQELALQKAVIQQQRIWQWALGIGLLLAGLLAYNWRRAFRNKSQLNRLIRAEQKRSDELLLNILPPAVAEELKAKNSVVARKFEHTTVLCTDFQDFTGVASQLNPEQLVQLLDEYFRGFDDITSKYQVEKIKTMGDAYMCAGGLSEDGQKSAAAVLNAAFAMRDCVLQINQRNQEAGKPFFNCRIGLHLGPVIAGVVGKKKFVYDIWGDTVNTATRMEQYGVAGLVNVSETVFQELQHEPTFEFEFRGKIDVKGKGALNMYLASATTSI